MSRVFTFLCLFLAGLCCAQSDSIRFEPGMHLEDGIYLDYNDFRHNNSIKKEQVVSKLDKSQLEFLAKVVFEEKFSYEENGQSYTVESKNVWGYIQNNILHVNYKGDFYRVPVFGAISYLVANVTIVSPGFYDPRFGMSGPSTTKEIREFLMDFYDGIPVELNPDMVERLLIRDPEIYAEYKKLSRRKQKEQVYGLLRKYNTRHPIYFLR